MDRGEKTRRRKRDPSKVVTVRIKEEGAGWVRKCKVLLVRWAGSYWKKNAWVTNNKGTQKK